MAEAAPDLLLAPQGVGGHVDHVQLSGDARARSVLPVLWWRDFPYTVRHPDPKEPFPRDLRGAPTRRRAPVAGGRGGQARGLRGYASQIGFQFGGPAASPSA